MKRPQSGPCRCGFVGRVRHQRRAAEVDERSTTTPYPRSEDSRVIGAAADWVRRGCGPTDTITRQFMVDDTTFFTRLLDTLKDPPPSTLSSAQLDLLRNIASQRLRMHSTDDHSR